MPPPYIVPHWNVFAGSPYQGQGPVGIPPFAWAKKCGIINAVPNGGNLPNWQLDRDTVRAICQDPANSVLFGYVCAMAWGGQGMGPGGLRNATAAWTGIAANPTRLNALRAGGMSRGVAYGAFLGSEAILGLGPSFFTKLLYFFSPVPSFYIMDSRTAQAVVILTGNWIARMNGGKRHLLAPNNNIGNYQAYCEEIDLIAGQLACTGRVAEERLFSRGGRYPWPWRVHVDGNWPTVVSKGYAYSATALNGIYPLIPLAQF